ncbi:hypothetical protein GGTG_00088 [Gaeumannomyces tritici R3-111a-1]|uniref:Uncharacterized protein n=1 Tax=Gaeumannomyces tritici (strain R3-111a-1) TaxID=644352 RepID=J3NFP3_GAET3|nr:hypothetical protein GGTG_00088 [Gaeumannomyces tritici R3-111a-1]EJT80083.1 hypothetical protein GGTG_00088 [Gaeumannomyces tritici R3-111a-1]
MPPPAHCPDSKGWGPSALAHKPARYAGRRWGSARRLHGCAKVCVPGALG